MGIRFWCPNGHKLNVKSFQAGRRGICPYCGAKFQIPAESTRQPGAKDLGFEPQEHSVHEGGGGTPPGAAPAAQPFGAGPTNVTPAGTPPAEEAYGWPSTPIQSGPAGPSAAQAAAPAPSQAAAGASGGPQGSPVIPLEPVGDLSSPGGAAAALTAGTSAPGGPQGAYSSAPLVAAGGAAAADPLAGAPDVVWYVRPPTGGQFGPATSDVMRNWVDEGRVSPDSLVWREGWRDWQEAAAVFTPAAAGEPELGNFLTQPSAGEAGGHGAVPRRGHSKTTGLIIIGLLVLAVIVLFGVFLYVAFSS